MHSLRPRRLGALALIVLAFGQGGAGSQEPAPQAVVREIGHDFGPVAEGGTVTHTFSVGNRGTAPLHILRVDASEPGMRSRFTEVVAPGDTGRVTIAWTPEGRSGDLNAHAVVHLSDPKRPRVTLALSGVLTQSIGIAPSSDVHLSVYADQSAERRVTIVNNEERPLAVTGLRPSGDHFRAAVVTVEPGRTYEVVVTAPPGLRPGRYIGDVFVDTDHPRLGPLRLVVHTFVKDLLYATPDAIDFGDVSLERIKRSESAPWLSQSATLVKREGDFAIVAISSNVDGLRVHRSPSGRSRTIGLVVTLDRHRIRPGELDGSIRIETDDRAFPVVVLPVRGRIH
jgi:hypothetical protein